MSSIQAIKTQSYNSNSDVLLRENMLFLKASQKTKPSSFIIPDCKCPKVLCCDDDSFQHFVLRKLLESLGSQKLQEASDIQFFNCGEDLITEFLKLKQNCQCGGPRLIITDFNMGNGNLTGLQVVHKLRSLGYRNPIIVRTSNNLRSLTDLDDEFDEKKDNQPVTLYLSKKNLKHQKEVLLQQLVENF